MMFHMCCLVLFIPSHGVANVSAFALAPNGAFPHCEGALVHYMLRLNDCDERRWFSTNDSC